LLSLFALLTLRPPPFPLFPFTTLFRSTMNTTFQNDLTTTVAKVKEAVEAGEVKGVVIASAKKTFFAGGDIKSMIKATPADAAELDRKSTRLNSVTFRSRMPSSA